MKSCSKVFEYILRHGQAVAASVMAVAAMTVAACANDSYDSGTGALSLTRADFVVAHTDEACAIDYVVTDGGKRLVPSARPAPAWAVKADTLYRAVFYYNVAADESAAEGGDAAGSESVSVVPVSMSQIPVLSPKPADSFEEGIRTDPVKFESMWRSEDGQYINIGIYLKNGTTGAEDEPKHIIGMAHCGTVTNADGTRTAFLTLYHDQGGVPEYYSSRYYISVPCADIDADSVCITVNTYDEGRKVIAPCGRSSQELRS